MPGKYTDGYTKQAQQQKFVRNRDIKLKDSEVRKEAKIQKLMCEGICPRCREKVQWKFRYDKYKPLRAPATCQECKQKKIVKAYRTLCDGCAGKRNVCPGCCEEMKEEEEEITSATSTEKPLATVFQAVQKVAKEVIEDDNGVVWGQTVEDGDVKENGDEEEDEEDEEDEDEEDDENDEEEEEQQEVQDRDLGMDLAWNEKKFANIAASKYSKDRVTGQEQPTFH